MLLHVIKILEIIKYPYSHHCNYFHDYNYFQESASKQSTVSVKIVKFYPVKLSVIINVSKQNCHQLNSISRDLQKKCEQSFQH